MSEKKAMSYSCCDPDSEGQHAHNCANAPTPAPVKPEPTCKCGGNLVPNVAHTPGGCYYVPASTVLMPAPAPKSGVVLVKSTDPTTGELIYVDKPAPTPASEIDWEAADRWAKACLGHDDNAARAYLALKAENATLVRDRDAWKRVADNPGRQHADTIERLRAENATLRQSLAEAEAKFKSAEAHKCPPCTHLHSSGRLREV
jgi:hypothetical protein